MASLSITKDGKLYESDPARMDGRGVGRIPDRVTTGTMVLSNPLLFRQEQNLLKKLEVQKQKRLGAEREQSFKNKKAQAIALNKDRSRLMSNQKPIRDPAQELIKGELMRQKASNADFFSYERMTDTHDFGRNTRLGSNRADFRTYSIYAPSGNPLTSDGSYGPVTDFDRIVAGKRFANGIPQGMNKSRGGMGDFWSDLVDHGEAELQKLANEVSSNPVAAIQTGLQQAGLIPKPPTTQAPIPSFFPAPIKQALTGTITIPGTSIHIQKAYLAYGGIAALLLGGATWYLKRSK